MTFWRLRLFGNFLFYFICWGQVQYKWCQHMFYHIRKSSQLEVEFPHAPDGHPGQYYSGVGLPRLYKCVYVLLVVF